MNQTAVRNQTTGVVASMTGYGNGQQEFVAGGHSGLASCEVRTVNSRFVDVQCNPWETADLDLQMALSRQPQVPLEAVVAKCQGKAIRG